MFVAFFAVCIKFLTKLGKQLDNRDDIEKELLSLCESSKGKDHRFVCVLYGIDRAIMLAYTC